MLYEATGEVEGYYNRAHEKLNKLSKYGRFYDTDHRSH
jgi:hypothetical protein